jgi:curved DNA-binding protein CbpA
MKNCWNYYELLHVQPDAPTEIIRSSYRTLMLKLKQHPDIGGDGCRAAMINLAYETLTHPEKRAEYDRMMFGAPGTKGGEGFPDLAPRGAGRGRRYGPYRDACAPPMGCCVFCKTPYYGDIPPSAERLCACCGSPLNPVESGLGLNAEQRRAARRMAQDRQVTFYTAWPQRGFQGHIRDLSPMGMQMDSPEALQASQVIKIESDLLKAAAAVVHCRETVDGGRQRCVAGIKFFTLWFQSPLGTFLSITA